MQRPNLNTTERDVNMSDLVANDLRTQYGKAFKIVRRIVEIFPENRWREPHGDIYYLPCRIAYHIAAFIDSFVADGLKDNDFHSKLPYGRWMDATAETLPDRTKFLVYLDAVISRAEQSLAALTDEFLMSPMEPEKARIGASQMGLHLLSLREIADHTGELNKMLIEYGLDDVFM
jgi:hypothetical protein